MQDLGFWVWAFRFGVWDLGFEVWDLGFEVTARVMHDGAVMKTLTISLISPEFACQ